MIDLRSDTVTKPSREMRKVMYDAEVGDDVYGEDPTVNKLQEYCAALFNKEAALFVSSGVMGNQLCLHVHTTPGDEVICERKAHIFTHESGSPAALSGITLNPIDGNNGALEAQDVIDAIKPAAAYYMPRTRAIAVENTHNRASGAVIPVQKIAAVYEVAKQYNLKYHLDAARIWNASVASGVPVHEYSKYFDSLSACFSKGLGAPAGSIIAGSKDFIKEAFRIRKAWGGGMRQIGILAAAAQFALENNIARLAEDHNNAAKLVNALRQHEEIVVEVPAPNTNIVLFELKHFKPADFIAKCKNMGLLLSVGTISQVRAVTHMDVADTDIDKAISIIRQAAGLK